MTDIVGKKGIYFAISLIVMIPGIIALFLWGLQLSIDFTGGTRLQYNIVSEKPQTAKDELQKIVKLTNGVLIGPVQNTQKDTYSLRMKTLTNTQYQNMKKILEARFPTGREISFETVGPTIGTETTWNAFKAVGVAILLIVLYMAWSFRNVPKPASSWRFGVCTIAALLHDVIVVVGLFAILGHFYGVEIDSLFITAVLTVIG
nr:protein translocase subunit SecF [Candidatus Levybacteria bacterium]